MAIKLDEDNNVVVYENEPEDPRSMFPNIKQDFTAEINSILDRLSIIHPGIHPGTIGSSGAINPPTEVEAGVYTDEFPVTPGDTVNYSLKYSEVRLMMINVVFYDASHTFIQRKTLYLTNSNMYEGYFVVPDNVYYCRFSYITYNEGYLNIKTSGQRLNDVQFNGESIVKNGVAYIPALDEYELIKDITLTENAGSVVFDSDAAGASFKLRKLKIVITMPPSTTGTRVGFTTYANAKLKDNDTLQEVELSSILYPTTSGATLAAFIDIDVSKNAPFTVITAYSQNMRSNVNSSMRINDIIADYFTSYEIAGNPEQNIYIPEGAQIKLYGVRY